MFPYLTTPGLHPGITLPCCIGNGFLSTGTRHPEWTPRKRLRGKSPISCLGPPWSSAPGCSASGQASGWWPAPVWTGGSGDMRCSTPCPQEQKFHRKGNNKPRRVILRRVELPETGRTFLPQQDKQAHWGKPQLRTTLQVCIWDSEQGISCWGWVLRFDTMGRSLSCLVF